MYFSCQAIFKLTLLLGSTTSLKNTVNWAVLSISPKTYVLLRKFVQKKWQQVYWMTKGFYWKQYLAWYLTLLLLVCRIFRIWRHEWSFFNFIWIIPLWRHEWSSFNFIWIIPLQCAVMLSDMTHRKEKFKNTWLITVYPSTALEKSAHEIGYPVLKL